MKSKTCDICGIDCDSVTELKAIYQTPQLKALCNSCGEVADSFVNYYGKKKPEDVARLHLFLMSGKRQVDILTATMNAGYF
jgi:hypothetical protein